MFSKEFRVYYDEDVNRSGEEEIITELEELIFEIPSVEDVVVEEVFMSSPYEAIVLVDFDTVASNADRIAQEISVFDEVHNARES
jgi:hypothetical protein